MGSVEFGSLPGLVGTSAERVASEWPLPTATSGEHTDGAGPAGLVTGV